MQKLLFENESGTKTEIVEVEAGQIEFGMKLITPPDKEVYERPYVPEYMN